MEIYFIDQELMNESEKCVRHSKEALTVYRGDESSHISLLALKKLILSCSLQVHQYESVKHSGDVKQVPTA